MSTLTQKQRDALAASSFGDPKNRLFPILDQNDVDSAAHLIGKADDPEAVKRRIMAIARRLGLKLPAAWKETSKAAPGGIERKTLDLVGGSVTDDGHGTLTGHGAAFGNVDRQRDMILPGAFKDTLSAFERDGFLAWNHAWDQPIATIQQAHEDSHGLALTAEFHSTPDAQRARTIAQERLARGKSMALSIGYGINPGGAEHTKDARLLKSLHLYEVSLVAVPANDQALVTAAKAYPLAGMDAEPPEGSYEELAEDLAEAYAAAYGLDEQRVQTVATFTGHAVLCVLPDYSNPMGGADACAYWDVPYTVGADDDALTLGTPQPVDPQMTYVPSDDAKGLVLPLCALQAACKRGARHNKPTRERYAAMMTHATALVDHIGSLQQESAPPDPPSKAEGRQQLVEYLAWEARRLGVAV